MNIGLEHLKACQQGRTGGRPKLQNRKLAKIKKLKGDDMIIMRIPKEL